MYFSTLYHFLKIKCKVIQLKHSVLPDNIVTLYKYNFFNYFSTLPNQMSLKSGNIGLFYRQIEVINVRLNSEFVIFGVKILQRMFI